MFDDCSTCLLIIWPQLISATDAYFLGGEILSPEEAEGADKDNGKSTPPSLHKYYRWQFAKQTRNLCHSFLCEQFRTIIKQETEIR